MKIFRLTALSGAFGAFAFAAQAVSFTVIDSSTQGVGNQADVFAPNFAAHTPAGATFDKDATVTPPPGNASGIYQSPFNNTSLVDTQSYFSVGAVDGDGDGATSPVTLTLGGAVDIFKILWGSIDSYNKISFFDSSDTLLGSFTGTDIIVGGGLGGTSNNFEQVALLNFTDFGQSGLSKIKFESSSPAFEFALAPIPLPASVLLLLGALSGLGFIGARRRRAAAA